MSVSSPVANSTKTSTTADIVRLATWVRPPCSSRIWVLVGLPLTTKVPRQPGGEVGAAEPEDVPVHVDPLAVLQREAAGGRRALGDDQDEAGEGDAEHLGYVAPGDALRQPDRREPARHRPTTATPCAAASSAADRMIDRTTATIAPGTLGTKRSNPTMSPRHRAAKATVSRWRP